MLKLTYLALISTFFNCLCAIELSNDFHSNSFISKPLFLYSDPEQEISLEGENATLMNSFEYLIENPKLEIKTDKFSTNIKALQAEFNRRSKFINFRNSVTFKTFFEKEILIESEKLSFDFNEQKLVSNLSVFASMNGVKVNSLGIEILQLQDGLKAEFNKGEIKIKIKENYHLGSADKVTILSDLNELIMDGNAYFNQDGLIIKSDTIHYSLERNKIIKSLNSKIENSL
tara:strand:+ start:503 stop:1192 length:690 start_codon:yes stop_codon:yes gene_type:complete